MPGARADGSAPRAGRTPRAEGGGLGCLARAITVPGSPVFTDVPEYGTPGVYYRHVQQGLRNGPELRPGVHQPPPLRNSKTIP
jgi:hypothetical protein